MRAPERPGLWKDGRMSAEAFTPNIGPRGIRRRRTMGWIVLAAGVAGAVAMAAARLGPAWRLALLPIFQLAGIYLYQAREKT